MLRQDDLTSPTPFAIPISSEPFDRWPAIEIPPRLRLLCIGPEEPMWVSLTLQLDAEGCLEPKFQWVSSSSEALTLLRETSFDCLVINQQESASAHTAPPNPLDFVHAIRASGCDDPVVLVVRSQNDELWSQADRAKCELLVTPNGWESLALVTTIKRAMARVELQRANHRLELADRKRSTREHDEAEQLLGQQRRMLEEVQRFGSPHLDEAESTVDRINELARPWAEPEAWRTKLPRAVIDHYQELLRTYVIMGAGNLGTEIAQLAEVFAATGLTPREALELHLDRVEHLVRGLGNRSTRHVVTRADLLALEVLVHLGEHYLRQVQLLEQGGE
jgi:hypothetical protein